MLLIAQVQIALNSAGIRKLIRETHNPPEYQAVFMYLTPNADTLYRLSDKYQDSTLLVKIANLQTHNDWRENVDMLPLGYIIHKDESTRPNYEESSK